MATPYGSNPYMSGGFGDGEGGNVNGGGLSAQYQGLQQSQQQLQQLLSSYNNPTSGFGGFSYAPTSAKILPGGLGYGYGQAAGFALQGSQGAQEQLRQQYEAQLRSRTGGAGMAYQQAMGRGAAGLAGQGVSAPLQQLLLHGQSSNLLSQMAQGEGEDEAGYHQQLAELMKGTGTELAGLKQNEVGSSLNYLVGQAGADAARPDPLTGIGQLLGGFAGIGGLFGKK